ncbi:MAG TPA: hypothetical protein VN937_27495 [Blastocatellia bacterium]|nr:hypothetical protein [Blastocatellia bacterium]
MKRTTSVPLTIISLALLTIITSATLSPARADAHVTASTEANTANSQSTCPQIFPAGPVAVAPNQPGVPDQSTVGIINALCDVTLDFIGCGFLPTSVILNCDSNGDGVSDLSIPLKNITVINGLFFQATIPALAASPGTAFPLACCGGMTTIRLSRTVGAGDDNAFGEFTQTITCSINLGIRAPVVISATPLEVDCALGQNVLIPGSCFLLAGGKANVTSVFAVDAANPNNIIQAHPIAILSNNLVDAFFQLGGANAGRTFLIYAAGPNGTSRNLTALPANSPAGCPLGNEQGVPVVLKCKAATGSAGSGEGSTAPSPLAVSGCRVERIDTGAFVLSVFGKGIRDGATMTVGGVTPKKLKFKGVDATDGAFTQIVAKGRFCDNLPGAIVITNANGASSAPMVCGERCLNQ